MHSTLPVNIHDVTTFRIDGIVENIKVEYLKNKTCFSKKTKFFNCATEMSFSEVNIF